MTFGAILEMANTPAPVRFRPASRTETPSGRTRLETPLPPLPGRFGVSWDPAFHEGRGLRVTTVVRGSPAANAGLLIGDRITRLDGEDVDSSADPRELILACPTQVKLTVERPSEKSPIELTVQLLGPPIRVGIAWREDDAEPGSIIIARVVPESPADKAGLVVGDRICQLDGKRFSNGDEFQQRLTTASGKIELQMERQGRERTLVLEAARTASSRCRPSRCRPSRSRPNSDLRRLLNAAPQLEQLFRVEDSIVGFKQ